MDGGHTAYLDTDVGVPIGVESDVIYTSRTLTAPAHATFLAFTDGLVERRGEQLDDGLDRLRATANAPVEPGELQDLLDRLLGELRPGSQSDDTAIIGLRWTG
jgi:serine phosphatase RsbU (regulator of sigma subunit)